MTRRMADSITASSCPPGFPLYLGYIDGQWPSYFDLVKLYPHAIVVSCTVTGNGTAGTVIDVETGDVTPSGAVGAVVRRRAAGMHPTVYCNASTWPAVKAAFAQASIAEPEWLIASYGRTFPDPTIPKGAIGHQWVDRGSYDESTIADYWPGVDHPPIPAPTPVQPNPTWEFQMAEVRQTLIFVGPLDPKGCGYADWPPGLPNAPVVVGAVKQGPDPSPGSADVLAGDPYWLKQGYYDDAASPRGQVVRVVVTHGVPGETVGVYVSAA